MAIPTRLPAALVIVLTIIAPSIIAAEFYVSPGGSDSATGAAEEPFKTIAKAISAANDGDTIHLMAGEYSFPSPSKNRTTDFVTLRPAPGAEGQAVLTGYVRPSAGKSLDYLRFQNLSIPGGIHIDGTNHLQIRGCEIGGNATLYGIKATGSNILLEGNRVTYGSKGILVGGNNLTVRYNEVTTTLSDGFFLSASSSNVLVEGNYFHDNRPTEGSHPDHLQIYGPKDSFTAVRGLTIRGNYFDTHGQGIFGYASEIENVLIENNVVIATHSRAWSVETTNNVTVRNNLFCFPANQDPAKPQGGNSFIIMKDWGGGDYIYANNMTTRLSSPTSDKLLISHNLHFVDSPRGPGSLGPMAPTEVFVNFAGHDFSIKSTAPTINAGIAAHAATDDILGRPRGPQPDIGPVEYSADDTLPLRTAFVNLLTARQQAIRGTASTPALINQWHLTSVHGAAFSRPVAGEGFICSRLAAPRTFSLDLSAAANPESATAAAVTLSDASGADLAAEVTAVSLSTDGRTLTITLAALPDMGRYTLSITDYLKSTSDSSYEGARAIVFRTLAGDVLGTGEVTAADVAAVRQAAARELTPETAACDVDGSGEITGADMRAVHARLGNRISE